MIVDNLKIVLDKNNDKNSLYLRNLLKEQLQNYLLNYIYNSQYGEKFIFKGGTCLRFCFELPRLSEDLDFDVDGFSDFNFDKFTGDLKNYFLTKLKYSDLSIQISGKNKIIYLKFPILEKIGFPVNKNKPSESTLFVRIDLNDLKGKYFSKEISLKSTSDFSFIIKRYALTDIFAGKLAAVLLRESWEGKEKQPRFKGRDYFDICWLMQKKIRPNFSYLKTLIEVKSDKELLEMLKDKFQVAIKKKQIIKDDLLPFFSEENFIEDFINSLDSLLNNLVIYLK